MNEAETTPRIITHPLHHAPSADATQVAIQVDRLTLAKRRWRATADDGTDLGFDLDTPLRHGDCVFAENDKAYVIDQTPEPVLEISLSSITEAITLAWSIGNLHQVVQPLPDGLRMPDDPALRTLLASLHVPLRETTARFEPLRGSGHHHHQH